MNAQQKVVPAVKKLFSNLLFVFGLIFLVRLLLLIIFGQPWNQAHWTQWITEQDTKSYADFANALYYGAWDFYPPRLPGYPFFMILTRTAFGTDWLGTIIFQQILSIVSAWILYLISRLFLKRSLILIAVIFLFEPIGLITSYLLLPETCMILIQMLSIFVMLLAARSEGKSKLLFVILSALILCTGVFFKPILMYGFLINALFIPFFFKDVVWKRILYAVIFIIAFQIPLHYYRDYIKDRFGVYSLTRQEFSEKAARTIDIKLLNQYNHPVEPDSIRAEFIRTLIAGGFDYNKPDHILYTHICDSIAKTNMKKYAGSIAYHSFADCYMFFQPAAKMFSKFLTSGKYETIAESTTAKEKVAVLKERTSSLQFIFILLISVLYSALLIIPTIISVINKNIRKAYAPIIYFAVMWFLYTSVAVGRIAQARYRVTFIWLFAILAGIVYAYVKENGWRSVVSLGKSNEKD